MNVKTYILVCSIGFIIVVFILVELWVRHPPTASLQGQQTTPTPTALIFPTNTATITPSTGFSVSNAEIDVNMPNGKEDTYIVQFTPGQSLFTVIQALQAMHEGFSFTYTGLSSMPQIATINGIALDGYSQFWNYKINSLPSTAAIGYYKVQNSDIIDFYVQTVTGS